MTTPNQITGNFNQIAVADTDGNVTGIKLASAADLELGGGTVGQYLKTDGTGALEWAPAVVNYGTIKKMTGDGFNGMLTLMEDGRLYLTRGSAGYNCYYDTVTTDNLFSSFYGTEATHQILPSDDADTGKIIDAGIYGTSAYMLMDNGNLYTWGQNGFGQLGLGNTVDRFIPTLAATGVTTVYTDGTNSQRTGNYGRLFIKKTDGKIWGCGYNGLGALGIGSTTNQSSFVEITGAGVNPKSVWNMGNYVGCLVVQRADGVVVVAGYNGYGSLGNATTTNILTLTAVPAWQNSDNTLILERVAGGYGYEDSSAYNHTNMFMWFKGATTDLIKGAGSNAWGTLATGNNTDSNVPVTITIPGLGRIDQFGITGGAPANGFVLKSTGTLYGWGYNGQGNLGIGTDVQARTVTQITTDVLEVPLLNEQACGGYEYYSTTYIRKADGYYACGRGNQGQRGDGAGLAVATTFRKMRLPRGTVIKHWGRNVSGNALFNVFMVDDKNRWWACGQSANYAISNQRWVDSNNIAYSPIRVQPFDILSDNGYI
jgi:alpha-tubulin suppressor-like RCC1 family protein